MVLPFFLASRVSPFPNLPSLPVCDVVIFDFYFEENRLVKQVGMWSMHFGRKCCITNFRKVYRDLIILSPSCIVIREACSRRWLTMERFPRSRANQYLKCAPAVSFAAALPTSHQRNTVAVLMLHQVRNESYLIVRNTPWNPEDRHAIIHVYPCLPHKLSNIFTPRYTIPWIELPSGMPWI